MSLSDWERRLAGHFAELQRKRLTAKAAHRLFALEHGLDRSEFSDLSAALRAHIKRGRARSDHALAWLVYAAELGYEYDGNEYWQTFEERTPGWTAYGDRDWIRDQFIAFAEAFGGAEPSGTWAEQFSIICWPITHAVLPIDLQRQLARALYDLRHRLSRDIIASPQALGRLIAGWSGSYTSRFRNIAQEPALLGQIAAALVLDGSEATALLSPPTLQRIVTDLEQHRIAREWLRDARRYARDRTTLHGLGAARQEAPTSRPTPADVARGRREIVDLGIEPRIVLRPKSSDCQSWDVLLEIPDLSHLLERYPDARDALMNSRCVVAGATGVGSRDRPLPREALLHGQRLVTLGQWPRASEVLLKFERPSRQLDFLLRAECMLRPNDLWLFRIASDGVAYELRGLRGQPGESYVLLSKTGPIQTGSLARSVQMSCAGAWGAFVEIPSAIGGEHAAELLRLGVTPAKSIAVWPAGLAAARWDGDGRAEWLVTDQPCIALRADHDIRHIAITAGAERLQIERLNAGESAFVELPRFRSGLHTVRVTAEQTNGAEVSGELVATVREPRAWSPREGLHAPFSVELDPARPSLEQLWQGEADVELLGPKRRSVTCTVTLIDEGDGEVSRQFRLELPVPRERWRALFERNLCAEAEVQRAYDKARACTLDFDAEELGKISLRVEPAMSALRWRMSRDTESRAIVLRDDTSFAGAAGALTVDYYSFEEPDTARRIPTADALRGVTVPRAGGMYLASREPVFHTATIVPPLVQGLRDLGSDPRLSNRVRAPERVEGIIKVFQIWSRAKLAGNVLIAAHNRHLVLRALTQHLFYILGGADWLRAESTAPTGENGLRHLKFAASPNREENLAFALASEVDTLASKTAQERANRLAAIADRRLRLGGTQTSAPEIAPGVTVRKRQATADPGDPVWLCEFALRLASDPMKAWVFAGGNANAAVRRLFTVPALARAARFLVLAVDRRGRVGFAADTLHHGWSW